MNRTALVTIILAILTVSVVSGCAHLTGRTAGEIMDDSSIKITIQNKIISDPELSYLKVGVDSTQGNVTLTGYVPNRTAENRLIGIARQVRGVKSVRSELMIEHSAQ